MDNLLPNDGFKTCFAVTWTVLLDLLRVIPTKYCTKCFVAQKTAFILSVVKPAQNNTQVTSAKELTTIVSLLNPPSAKKKTKESIGEHFNISGHKWEDTCMTVVVIDHNPHWSDTGKTKKVIDTQT